MRASLRSLMDETGATEGLPVMIREQPSALRRPEPPQRGPSRGGSLAVGAVLVSGIQERPRSGLGTRVGRGQRQIVTFAVAFWR